jgi:hypothetical protein
MWRVETVTTGLDGSPFLSTHWFNDTAGTVDDAVASVVELWGDLASVIVNDLTMSVQSTVYVVDQATGLIEGTTISGEAADVVGLDTSTPLASATQGLIRWLTGDYLGGREVRGRMFIPGPSITALTNGGPSTTYQGVLSSAALTFIGNPGTLPVVYSRVNANAAGIVTGSPWNEFAVLRSRRD